MSKINYLLGLFKHILNIRISKFALIDNQSEFHKTTKVYRNVKVANSKVDAFTYIAPRTEIVHAEIGKFCSIGRECLIGLPNHSFKNISSSPIFTSVNNATKFSWTDNNTFNEFRKVQIGNDVWIGSRAIIMGGISIGNGAVVGAGAIVTKDVPPYSIVAGVPAHIIKYRFDENLVHMLLEIEWWNLPEEYLRNNIEIFTISDLTIDDIESTFNSIRSKVQ